MQLSRVSLTRIGYNSIDESVHDVWGELSNTRVGCSDFSDQCEDARLDDPDVTLFVLRDFLQLDVSEENAVAL